MILKPRSCKGNNAGAISSAATLQWRWLRALAALPSWIVPGTWLKVSQTELLSATAPKSLPFALVRRYFPYRRGSGQHNSRAIDDTTEVYHDNGGGRIPKSINTAV
jgi:hypothetical protein